MSRVRSCIPFSALAALVFAGMSSFGCAPPPADLVLVGGKVVTVDDELPRAEAIAVSGNRIAAVGTEDDIRARVGADTRVVELEGRTVIPGLIEGHAHFMSLGEALSILDLTTAESW